MNRIVYRIFYETYSMKFQVKWCLFDKSVISILFGAPVEPKNKKKKDSLMELDGFLVKVISTQWNL